VNFPSITAEEAPRLRPFIALAEKLGSFAGQLTETGLKRVRVTYQGEVAGMKTKALTSSAVAGLLRPMLAEVNVVSAPSVAKERGVVVEELTREQDGDYDSLVTVTVVTETQERSVSGTVFGDGRPRIVDVKGLKVDAEFAPSMIYISNEDRPGFIGRFATTLGDAGVNIATFALGRDRPGGSAIALVQVDGEVPGAVLDRIQTIPGVKQAKPLRF
jgi:D-3-phosphoglycerate dehydrogenase